MAQYCDPIAYNFSFKAITANDVEPALKGAFRDLVMLFRDCILEYGGFGGPPCRGLTPNYIWIMFATKDDIPMDVPSRILCPQSGRAHEEDEIYPSEVSRAEAEAHLLEALMALDDPRCRCMDLWIDDKHSRRRYYGRSTKLGKSWKA